MIMLLIAIITFRGPPTELANSTPIQSSTCQYDAQGDRVLLKTLAEAVKISRFILTSVPNKMMTRKTIKMKPNESLLVPEKNHLRNLIMNMIEQMSLSALSSALGHTVTVLAFTTSHYWTDPEWGGQGNSLLNSSILTGSLPRVNGISILDSISVVFYVNIHLGVYISVDDIKSMLRDALGNLHRLDSEIQGIISSAILANISPLCGGGNERIMNFKITDFTLTMIHLSRCNNVVVDTCSVGKRFNQGNILFGNNLGLVHRSFASRLSNVLSINLTYYIGSINDKLNVKCYHVRLTILLSSLALIKSNDNPKGNCNHYFQSNNDINSIHCDVMIITKHLCYIYHASDIQEQVEEASGTINKQECKQTQAGSTMQHHLFNNS